MGQITDGSLSNDIGVEVCFNGGTISSINGGLGGGGGGGGGGACATATTPTSGAGGVGGGGLCVVVSEF